MGPLTLHKNGSLILKIFAKPGAKRNNIINITDEAVEIAISAPPVDGEANKELIKYLAEVLEVRKSDLSLDKGSRSRQKLVLISGQTEQTILEKLKKLNG